MTRDVLGPEMKATGFRRRGRSDLKRVLEWKRYATPEPGRRGLHSTTELVTPDARLVFEAILGKKREAIADLRTLAANGFSSRALQLARRLGLSTRGISATRNRRPE